MSSPIACRCEQLDAIVCELQRIRQRCDEAMHDSVLLDEVTSELEELLYNIAHTSAIPDTEVADAK